MSYGSKETFTGKSHDKTNPRIHKKVVMGAAIILIIAAIAWTFLYTKSIETSTGAPDLNPAASDTVTK